jgi:thermosome
MAQKQQIGGRPMFILSEDSERTHRQDAQSSNIAAGKAISEAVRTTLGPRGMDKMLVSDTGDVVITNDGATLLSEMDINHPAAQMIVEVAETQEEAVGDGTTTAAVLAGELLTKAETLLDDDIHPTTIVEGYHEAAQLAHEAVDEQVLAAADLDDDRLRGVATTSMTGKGTGDIGADVLADTVVKAVRQVKDKAGVARDEIAVRTQTGASSSATELVKGVISEEEPVREDMARTVADASIAVVDAEFDIRESNVDAEYDVSSVDQLNAAIDAEESQLSQYADALADLDIDVAFVTEDIEDRAAAYLAEEGILAFEDVDDDEARAIGQATGASRVGAVEDLEDGHLGTAEQVRVESYGEDDLAFVEGGAAAEAVTVFARGGTDHVTDELERALHDGLDVVTTVLSGGGVIPGGGAPETAIAAHVRDQTASIEGRRQLAVEAFADAVDILPRTLAKNAGMDPIDALVDLRSRHDGVGRSGIIIHAQQDRPHHRPEAEDFVSRLESMEPGQIPDSEVGHLQEIARKSSMDLTDRSYSLLTQQYLHKNELQPQDILGVYETLLYAHNSHPEWIDELNNRLDAAFNNIELDDMAENILFEGLPDSVSIQEARTRFDERQRWLQPEEVNTNNNIPAQELYVYALRDRIDSKKQYFAPVKEISEVGDPLEHDILEPSSVKHKAIDSATEAATMIARIDDVITAE